MACGERGSAAPTTRVGLVSVVPLAVARAGLAGFARLARDRVRQGTSQPLAERETIQSGIGRAEATLRAARGFLVATMEALMAAVDRGDPDLLRERADLRLAASHAADAALRVAAILETAAGSAAIFEGGPLARRLRDLRAAVQHAAMSPNYFAVGGRLLLGLEPGASRI